MMYYGSISLKFQTCPTRHLVYDGPLQFHPPSYMCLNYDTEMVDGVNLSVPTSLWDLTEEEWRGKVAIPSPRQVALAEHS